jgi:hypothetical protein
MSKTVNADFIDEFEKEVAENIRLFIHDESIDWLAWYAIDKKMQSDLDMYKDWTVKIASQDSFAKKDADYVYHAKNKLGLLQKIIEWFNRQPTGFTKDGRTPLIDKQHRKERAAQIEKEFDLSILPHISKAFKGHTIDSILKFAEEQSANAGLKDKIRNYYAVDLLMEYCDLKRHEAVETLQIEWKTLLNRTEKGGKIQFAKERSKFRHLFPKGTPH